MLKPVPHLTIKKCEFIENVTTVGHTQPFHQLQESEQQGGWGSGSPPLRLSEEHSSGRLAGKPDPPALLRFGSIWTCFTPVPRARFSS